jgi:hypothetical protein
MSSSNLAKASLRLPCGRAEVIVVVEAILWVGWRGGWLKVNGVGGGVGMIELLVVI